MRVSGSNATRKVLPVTFNSQNETHSPLGSSRMVTPAPRTYGRVAWAKGAFLT